MSPDSCSSTERHDRTTPILAEARRPNGISAVCGRGGDIVEVV
jgi:hypothetical protein